MKFELFLLATHVEIKCTSQKKFNPFNITY